MYDAGVLRAVSRTWGVRASVPSLRPWSGGIIWLVGFIVLSGSCISPVLPEGDGVLAGPVVAVGRGLWSHDDGGPFQIHVKSDPQDECGIIFTVDSSSEIVDSRDAESATASAEILVDGALVAVWFTFVNQSCPGQSRAETVERLK